MFGILLHLLQMLLLTLEAPGVVLELRHGVTVAKLQPVVQHLSLPQPLQLHVPLQLVETGRQTEGELHHFEAKRRNLLAYMFKVCMWVVVNEEVAN